MDAPWRRAQVGPEHSPSGQAPRTVPPERSAQRGSDEAVEAAARRGEGTLQAVRVGGGGLREAGVFDEIADDFAAHGEIEEKIFYPAVYVGELKEKLQEAVEEHLAAKRIVADLLEMEPTDEQFDPKMKVLRELIEHHVEEEEGELFPLVRRTSPARSWTLSASRWSRCSTGCRKTSRASRSLPRPTTRRGSTEHRRSTHAPNASELLVVSAGDHRCSGYPSRHPSGVSALQRADPVDPSSLQPERHPGARPLVGSTTEEDHVAAAGNLPRVAGPAPRARCGAHRGACSPSSTSLR